jgi:site-specific DNA-methyltransferase (adenine-specific)
MLIENKAHVPDILDCIANLSSDEVFTPPDVANQVLNLLPEDLWSNPDIKILDPCCKTGIFLREAARRFMKGLEEKIPDEEKRREHIFKNMLHGIAITQLTALVSRRSLYYTKEADNKFSVADFDNPDGNISYKRMEHDYVQGKCRICGSPFENLERGDTMENYAYQFIHEQEASEMKFDVVVGNPPYQLQDGGGLKGSSASPIYQLFVNQAFRLKPRYVAMVIPSRWFSGGKGLDEFREQMLSSTNFRELIDYPAAADLFPTVEIKGGVCYFVWDSKYEGPCNVTTNISGQQPTISKRYLGEHGDTFVRYAEAIPILQKVQSKSKKFVDEHVKARKPFGLNSNFADYFDKQSGNSIELYRLGGKSFVKRNQIISNEHLIDEWKVLLGKGYNGGDAFPHQIMGHPLVAAPGSACTETYLILGTFKNKKEAENFAAYVRTRFFRFLVFLRKNTQNMSQSKFRFAPQMDLSISWTDESLYKYFGISKEEISFIESLVREMQIEK